MNINTQYFKNTILFVRPLNPMADLSPESVVYALSELTSSYKIGSPFKLVVNKFCCCHDAQLFRALGADVTVDDSLAITQWFIIVNSNLIFSEGA